MLFPSFFSIGVNLPHLLALLLDSLSFFIFSGKENDLYRQAADFDVYVTTLISEDLQAFEQGEIWLLSDTDVNLGHENWAACNTSFSNDVKFELESLDADFESLDDGGR